MNGWALIATAAVASYVLRILPLLLFRRLQLRADSRTVRFLSHAAAGVMGGIIYAALFSGHLHGEQGDDTLTAPMVALRLAVVVLAATFALWRREVFTPLLACTALAAGALLLMASSV